MKTTKTKNKKSDGYLNEAKNGRNWSKKNISNSHTSLAQ